MSGRDMRAAVEFIESNSELMAPLYTQTYPRENVEDRCARWAPLLLTMRTDFASPE